MPIIEWKEDYLVGVQQIDLHHQYLFAMLNKTYDSFVNKDAAERLNSLFDELIDYATYHFSTEEDLMRKIRYPDLEKHKKEHDVFAGKVVEIQKDYQAGRKGISLEILSFLQGWLSVHILQTDREIGRFLVSLNKIQTSGVLKNDVRVGWGEL